MSAHIEAFATAKFRVDAVLARLRIPAEGLASVRTGDQIDIEAEAGAGLMVRLSIDGATVACASVEEVGGRLVGTIIADSADSSSRIDQWKLRRS